MGEEMPLESIPNCRSDDEILLGMNPLPEAKRIVQQVAKQHLKYWKSIESLASPLRKATHSEFDELTLDSLNSPMN